MKHRRYSAISKFHYLRLLFRGALFLLAVYFYVIEHIRTVQQGLAQVQGSQILIIVVCIIFTFEMIMRFFPNKFESPGCQKQFKQNYIKSGETEIHIEDNHSVMLIALIWIFVNAAIGIFKMMGFLDDGIMILLCLLYSVCDIVCILFFCPFQAWFMKNKCCVRCRIYNWDYIMMFTPLLFVRSWYAIGLLVISAALMLRWEITIWKYPERFAVNTNDYMKCANCNEKLCMHKRHLRSLWIDISAHTKERIKKLKR